MSFHELLFFEILRYTFENSYPFDQAAECVAVFERLLVSTRDVESVHREQTLSISQSRAERKYGVEHQCISRLQVRVE